jgi:hypothetical protein
LQDYCHSLSSLIPVMPEGLAPILVIIALVIVYTLAKVIEHMRRSDEQWREADKSKLREWDDDDDWDN